MVYLLLINENKKIEKGKTMSVEMFKTIDLLEKVLDVRAAKHSIIASNIANYDTPNYKSADLNFEQTLKETLKQQSAMEIETIDSRHLEGIKIHGKIAPVIEIDSESNLSNDLNTVDIDEEFGKMSNNALQYNIVAKLIRNRFAHLKEAINEGGNP